MAAFTASQASVTNGSKIVTINSGESIANIRQGDFLFLAGFLAEINRGYVGGSSQQYIELVKNWANSSQSSQSAIVIPTTGDFRAAVDTINNANQNVNDNFKAMQDWQTNMGTVTFTNQDGTTTTVKTLKQIEADNAAQMDAYHPYPWAMRKVEFEASRAANNEKYAASGFIYKGKKSTIESQNVADGLYVSSTLGYQKQLYLGREISNLGNSKFDHPVANIAGVVTNLIMRNGLSRNTYELNAVKFAPAEDGTRTYDSANGISVTHATPAIAFASETESNKVVTDRVDMWGILQIEQEINDNYPFVYPNGLPQALAATMNSVATTTNNIQPLEYFAQYAGDTSSRGKGVNWQAATDAQRILLASDPKNKIYFNDATGKFYQTHNFALSFAGMGNGDWLNIDAITGDLAFSSQSKLVPALAENAIKFSVGTEIGVFTANSNPDCHFLVCGTVNRLNKGAYHPSYNSNGSASFVADPALNARPWYHSNVVATNKIKSSVACFNYGDAIGDVHIATGSISSSNFGAYASGRPDGRLFDAIYPSGEGGVCRDMRYSAWDLKDEDFAETDLAIKSGNYRGREKLRKVKFIGSQLDSKYTGITTSVYLDHSLAQLNDLVGYENVTGYIIVDGAEILEVTGVLPSGSNSLRCYLKHPSSSIFSSGHKFDVVLSQDAGGSVSSEWLHTEVIGDPANILLCDDLKNGWTGSWNPIIPDGTSKRYSLCKKASNTSVTINTTSNSGSSWSTVQVSDISPVTNSRQSGYTSNEVVIYNYKTKANFTKNALNLAIRNLNNVLVSDSTAQTTYLAFSLTGNINTSTSNQAVELSLNQIGIDLETGKLSASKETKHVAIPISAPTDNSSAFKALSYNGVDSQQGYVQYAATELKHNGVDWGDDGKIHIVDNQTTMLDENGNTVLVCTARCVEPLGWIKNDK